jgi:alkylation response protein AidB-like acyl-CoA dehydrogenase
LNMATLLDSGLAALQEKVDRFAEREAFSRLQSADDFPLALWRKMGEAGLLGLGLPAAHGGSGGGWLSIQAAAEAFVRRSHNLGMALSWLIHLIVARFALMGFGTSRQIEQWLPKLAAGETTLSLAISEPRTGAHPKYLKTMGTRRDDDWVLTGQKTFLTNGPLAGLFVVLAVTATEGEKKYLTAFLVSRESPGLSLTDPIRIDFLKPSPHCGIRLDNCAVSSDQVLGEPGSAFEKISKPFRELEDAMLMGPMAGGMEAQMSSLARLFERQSIRVTDALTTTAGELQARLDALRILAYEAAAMLDSGHSHPEFPSLLLSFRFLARHFQSVLAGLLEQAGIQSDPALETLTKDMHMTLGVAENVGIIKQKRIGEALLLQKG